MKHIEVRLHAARKADLSDILPESLLSEYQSYFDESGELIESEERQKRAKPQELRNIQSAAVNWPSSIDSLFAEPNIPYHLTPRLPLERREMVRAWRQFRILQREGPAEELDIQGTIHQICQNRAGRNKLKSLMVIWVYN